MTTSGTYSFSVTRDDIIRQAMLNIKRLDPNESPTSIETSDCARVLNMMCKQWMGKSDFAPGLKVWTRKRGHLLLNGLGNGYTLAYGAQGWTNTLIQNLSSGSSNAGTSTVYVAASVAASYSAGTGIAIEMSSNTLWYDTVTAVNTTTGAITIAGTLPYSSLLGSMIYGTTVTTNPTQAPLAIESAILRDDSYGDTPMRILTVQDWDMLPNKMDPTNMGDPSAILYEPGINTGTLWTDVGAAQDVSKHLVLTYFEPVQDFVNPLDTPYYPQEWYLALCWGLSEQISPMFGAPWGQKEEQLKNSALAIARNKGAEVSSLFFQPGAED